MADRYADGTPRIPDQLCAACGYRFDAASVVGKEGQPRPKAGDISVCLNCGHPTLFDTAGRHVEITEAEWAEIRQNADAMRILERAKRYCARAMGHDLSKRGGRA